MKIRLLSCNAARPDQRGIIKMLQDIAVHTDHSLARELADILLNGSEIEIEVQEKSQNSAMRSIRKLEIDYEIME